VSALLPESTKKQPKLGKNAPQISSGIFPCSLVRVVDGMFSHFFSPPTTASGLPVFRKELG
jgi:hypothetical protein